jgi:Ca-activated chloride channel family protein
LQYLDLSLRELKKRIMDSFRFAHPDYFYLLLVIPVLLALFVISRIIRKNSLRKFGNNDLLIQLMPSVSNARPVMKFIIWMVIMGLMITALAQPQFGSKLLVSKKKGAEIIIALDVSNSMMAEDIKPNRLERAKRAIAQLTERLKNDKLGLIVFAGQAYVQLPITTDYTSAKLFLNAISTSSVPVQGTAIGAAINMAVRSFTPDFPGSKAIIVISDGENHEDDAVGAAKAAKEARIIVHAIGMGLPQGVPIPIPLEAGAVKDYMRDKNNNVVVTKLDENMLTQIASAGGGTYIRASNTDVGLNSLFNEIDSMEKTELSSREYSEYNDQFPLFLMVGLGLIILEFMILDRKNKWLRNFRLFGREK